MRIYTISLHLLALTFFNDKTAVPELLQSPVMCGTILLILHFNGYDGLRKRSSLPLFGHAGGQQIRWQGRVKGVCQQYELELHLWVTQDIKHDLLLVLYSTTSCHCTWRNKTRSNPVYGWTTLV